MNDHELDLTLGAIGASRTRVNAPSLLRRRVRDVSHQPTATGGLLPSLTGRVHSMFSATKFVVAGAIVALFGGLLLIAQPFDRQESAVPGAATDDASMAMSRFTVLGRDDSGWAEGVSVTDEGLLLGEGNVEFGFIETTDPRFSGDSAQTYNGLMFDEETGPEQGISVGTMIVGNDGGRWIGTGTSILGQWTVVFEGVDGYEGLTAVVTGLEGEFAEGVIFPGDMPAASKDWCQLAREDLAAATSRMLDDENEIGRDRTSRLCPSLEMP